MPEETEDGGKGKNNEEFSSGAASEDLQKLFQDRRAKMPGMLQEELTSQEQDELWASVEKIRHSTLNPLPDYMIPKFPFPQVPQLRVPSGVIKRLTGAHDVDHRIAKSASPAFQIQGAWVKDLDSINSDIMKFSATQFQTKSIIEQLTKNVDLGAIVHYKNFSENFRAHQASWFKGIIPNLDKLKVAFWPANLRDIEGIDISKVEAVVMLDGIGLYNVPRQSIATAIIQADSARMRREILGRRWRAISLDCREAMASCESESLASYVATAISAMDPLDSGHTQAAQALVGSLTDALLIDYLGDKRYLYTPNRKTKNSDAYKEFGIRKFIALAPMWQAYQQFRASNGDAVPSTFNRNATAHTVNSRQFNRRNAVQGLLFVSGLITFLDEVLRHRQG